MNKILRLIFLLVNGAFLFCSCSSTQKSARLEKMLLSDDPKTRELATSELTRLDDQKIMDYFEDKGLFYREAGFVFAPGRTDLTRDKCYIKGTIALIEFGIFERAKTRLQMLGLWEKPVGDLNTTREKSPLTGREYLEKTKSEYASKMAKYNLSGEIYYEINILQEDLNEDGINEIFVGYLERNPNINLWCIRDASNSIKGIPHLAIFSTDRDGQKVVKLCDFQLEGEYDPPKLTARQIGGSNKKIVIATCSPCRANGGYPTSLIAMDNNSPYLICLKGGRYDNCQHLWENNSAACFRLFCISDDMRSIEIKTNEIRNSETSLFFYEWDGHDYIFEKILQE